MAYILDADRAIQALAGRQPELDALIGHAQEGIAIGWVTVGEIYEGAFGSPDPQTHLQAFRQFLAPLVTLNLNDTIMEQLLTSALTFGGVVSLFPTLTSSWARQRCTMISLC